MPDVMQTDAQPYADVQSYADVIAKITGIDVEIMDKNMMRIAGTGIYAEGLGHSLIRAGEAYKEVMRTRKTVIVANPRHDPVCLNCPDRENCRERFSLATPIAYGSELYGVIGLLCFNDKDRERMRASLDSYLSFISFLGDALGHKLGEMDRLKRATDFLDLTLQVLDVPGQGVMLFNESGSLIYSNAQAGEMFGGKADGAPDLGGIRRSGQGINDFEEFEVRLPAGGAHTVLGRLAELSTRSGDRATLFVFELPERLAQMVADLAVGAPGDDRGAGFDAIVGNSPAVRKLKSRAAKVVDSSSTVLIHGESGTGKELLARAIHRAGPRRDAPFVAVNCGGIPDTLLESELFGYVNGAFTGASSRGRMGKFELAHGGVLFLDEISTMPLHMQVKLLRVLQERVIVRLGSNRPIPVDVRVIAAGNSNLQERIRQNMFREDLYYRLNVIPLDMPPLREREGDIAVLAEYFLNKYCELFQRPTPRLPSSFLHLLESYSWPGNVRELEHALEYAVNMLPESGRLSLDCLPAHLLEAIRTESAPPASAPVPESAAVEPLRAVEERAVRAALERFGQSTEGKKRAARALGLSLATLYRKMAAFSL